MIRFRAGKLNGKCVLLHVLKQPLMAVVVEVKLVNLPGEAAFCPKEMLHILALVELCLYHLVGAVTNHAGGVGARNFVGIGLFVLQLLFVGNLPEGIDMR